MAMCCWTHPERDRFERPGPELMLQPGEDRRLGCQCGYGQPCQRRATSGQMCPCPGTSRTACPRPKYCNELPIMTPAEAIAADLERFKLGKHQRFKLGKHHD